MRAGLIALGLLAIAAKEPAAAPLPSVGKWQVEFADTMCVLSHQFGEGDNAVTVAFRPWPMGDDTEVALIAPGNAARQSVGTARVEIGPGDRKMEVPFLSWSPKGATYRLTTMNVPNDDLGDLAAIGTLSIAANGHPLATVAPAGIGVALPVLKKCKDGLLQSWGVDPTETDRIATPARKSGSMSTWFGPIDYPGPELHAGITGTTVVLWTIDAKAHVTNCRIVGSSGSAGLDQASCRAITGKGRYSRPAIGTDGKPMASHESARVNWALPY